MKRRSRFKSRFKRGVASRFGAFPSEVRSHGKTTPEPQNITMPKHELPEPQDDTDRQLLEQIDQHGWFIIAIPEEEEGPAYAFTVGLHYNFDHPEILIMGIGPETAHHLLNGLGEAIRQGEVFEEGGRYGGMIEGFFLSFVPMMGRHYRDYLGYAGWFYRGDNFPVLQAVWPDKAGVLPWEDNYEAGYFRLQPLLGPGGNLSEGWLFKEPTNVATFTLKQILHEGQPILHVVHDEEGAWQFLTGEPVTTEDALVVALREVVRHDPTMMELADLPTGWRASRDEVGGEWQREEI